MTIHINEIAARSISDVIAEFHEDPTEYEVEFHDGMLKCNGPEIIFTRFILNYWLKLPKEIPIMMRYSIAYKRELNPHTPLDLCTEIYRDYIDQYEFTEFDLDDSYMNRVVYKEVINGLYNFIVEFLDAYVQGADSFDIIDILNHPPIRAANEKIKSQYHEPTPEEIDECHDIVAHEMLHAVELKGNSWAIALRCKSIKMPQFQMIVSAIGYCTDLDSSLFPYSIRGGFYEGMAKLWEFAIESRNASIAALYNELIMPIAQYANRRYQLICQPVRWVVRADCGTRMYKETLITDATKLRRMEGLWRLDEGTGKLVCLKPSDTHLVGKVIKHRSSTYCEWNASRSEVCAVCHGRVYRAAMMLPPDSSSNVKGNNIGQIAAVAVGEKNSSIVLSRKHQNSTSVASKLVLSIEQSTYLEVDESGKYMLFHEKMRKLKDLNIILYKEQVEKLHDVKAGVIDITSPSSISQVEDFIIRDGTGGDDSIEYLPIILGTKQRTGYLSVDALEYIREHGWKYDNDKNLVVSLKNWNKLKPFFNIPQIEFSPPEFIEELTSNMLGPSKKAKEGAIQIRRLDSYGNPAAATDALYEQIQEHLDVHYSHLSIICLALSAQDPNNDDYRLPYPRHKGVMVTETPLVSNNSAGMSMAYEDQRKILSSPASYVLHRRRGHPLDTLLLSRIHGNRKKVFAPLPRDYKRPEDHPADL